MQGAMPVAGPLPLPLPTVTGAGAWERGRGVGWGIIGRNNNTKLIKVYTQIGLVMRKSRSSWG
jgi:hypothetical protein